VAAERDGNDGDDGDGLRWLAAGGDVFLCRDLPGHVACAGAAQPLAGIAPLLQDADAALANLEAVLAHGGAFARKGEFRPFHFHAPPETLNVLIGAGVTCVTAANNHAGDFGPEALAEQAALLAAHGLPMAGAGPDLVAARRPVLLDTDGLTIAVLAFTTLAPGFAAGAGTPGTFHLPADTDAMAALAPLLTQARAMADLVIVSPHWGANWRSRPTEARQRLARALVEAGADAVLGHSAHVLQGVELHADRPIVYDIGTLLADRVANADMARSALFRLGFDAGGVRRIEVHPLSLSPCETRRADDAEAGAIRARMRALSTEFDHAPAWQVDGAALVADLAPEPRPASTRDDARPAAVEGAPPVHRRAAISPVAPAAPPVPSFAVPGALPPDLAGRPGRDMGNGFTVYAQRHAGRVKPGYGFLVEVLFACPDPQGRPWRASLRVDPLNLEAGATARGFRYRHPVAEGLWLPQTWQDEAILRDAFVVRPPESWQAPGTWRLRWTLVDTETGRIWPASETEPAAGWAGLGMIELTEDAPEGVAGVDWGCEVGWTAVDAPGRR
jgi:poly-gamma-glutamate capsule biosynthesis protein CapA/YwtB (metallophosphatase superfamily)